MILFGTPRIDLSSLVSSSVCALLLGREEEATICSAAAFPEQCQPRNRDMLDYVPPHTHTYRNLRSPRVFEREIVFSSSLYWNLIPSLVRRDGILSQGRDVIRGLSRARNLLVSRTVRDVRARTHWLENDDPKEISTQVEHLSLEISSFETHSQQQHQEGFLKTGNDCHFHSSNFTRG